MADKPAPPRVNQPGAKNSGPENGAANLQSSKMRDTFHKAVALLIFGGITVCSVATLPLYFLNILLNSWSPVPLPWVQVERARRPRAIRENLGNPSSPYSRIGKPQVYHLASVSIIPETQKAALAVHPNKRALGYREVLEVLEKKDEDSGKALKQYRLSEYKWLTVEEVDKRITVLEKAFRQLGINHGHRVLIYSETRIGKFSKFESTKTLNSFS